MTGFTCIDDGELEALKAKHRQAYEALKVVMDRAEQADFHANNCKYCDEAASTARKALTEAKP